MLGWVAAVALAIAAGFAVGAFVRRERAFFGVLHEEVAGIREQVEDARLELKAMAGGQAGEMLNRVEYDDYEIADNLDRMNALLDQLNGLIKGKRHERREGRQPFFREDEPHRGSHLVPLDFASPEELRKFEALPPISDEEIKATDWEYLFNRIRTDDVE